MTLDEYQYQSSRTAVYPEAETGSLMALTYTALGLGNEAGEVQGKVKKVIRDLDGDLTDDARLAIADELGDVLWYAARLADELGVSLGGIAAHNLAKLGDRAARGALQGSGDNR